MLNGNSRIFVVIDREDRSSGDRGTGLWTLARPDDLRVEAALADLGAQLTGLVPSAHSPDACADSPFRIFIYEFRNGEYMPALAQ